MTIAKTDFFLYSPAKTGSTSLFHILATHPKLCPSTTKEPNYFSYKYDKISIEQYNDYFSCNSKNTLKYEATSVYFCNSNIVLDRIIKHCHQDIKFIIVLRNPLDRFISHYLHYRSHFELIQNHHLRENFLKDVAWGSEWENSTKHFQGIGPIMEDILEQKSSHFMIAQSLYPDGIKSIKSRIDPEKYLFIIYEDFKENNEKYLKEICNFLNIEYYDAMTFNTHKKHNTSNMWIKYCGDLRAEITQEHIDQLKQYFTPYIKSTEDLLEIKTNWLD